jgi:hypothetical protein
MGPDSPTRGESHGLPRLKALVLGATPLDRRREPSYTANPLIPGLKATESHESLSDHSPETLPRSDALLRRLTSSPPRPLAFGGQSKPTGDVKPAQDADDVESRRPPPLLPPLKAASSTIPRLVRG